MDDEDCEFEHSPLSSPFTFDGQTVDVEIFRLAGMQGRWHMEVIHFSGCTQWQDTFATYEDARAAFIAMVAAAGLSPFLGWRPEALN